MTFDFIYDTRFKELLLRDYQELKSCIDSKSSKAALILSGSIIEACLIEYFIQNLPAGQTEAKLLKLNLDDLIILAEVEGLLTPKEKNLASVVKDYRNLIHPGRQIRKNEKYDYETAKIANGLVNIILDTIKNKLASTTLFTAQEIVDKLEDDSNFRTIYDKVIIKLKQTERIKLLDLLLEYEIDEKEKWDSFQPEGMIPSYDYHNLQENIKELVTDLKPLLHHDTIIAKLSELIKEIQTGDRLRSFALFNFFHEDVDKLSPDEQETIAIYFLSIFSDIFEKSNTLDSDKTYSTIGKYIKTDKGLSAFKNFTEFCIVHFPKDSFFNHEMNVYEQAFNSLQEKQKEEVVKFAEDFLYKHGRPPEDIMTGFVSGAAHRGILKRRYDKKESDL